MDNRWGKLESRPMTEEERVRLEMTPEERMAEWIAGLPPDQVIGIPHSWVIRQF